MKWIFRKDNEECIVKVKSDEGQEYDFSYIEMIKELYENKKLEDVEFEGEFSENEKKSVDELVSAINEHVINFFEKSNALSSNSPDVSN